MEDEILRQNTDCVYFLASPFTCKKGSECEYRHSESARLNPRDCCYWLNGNCLNPSCAFRHPPLEGLTETLSKPVPLTSCGAVSTRKSNVPCYFYFNAYCIKGDYCPFLHDTLPAQKYPGTASEATNSHPLEKKTSTGSDTGPASVELPANASEGLAEPIKQCHSEKFVHQPAPDSVLEEHSPSVEFSAPDCEEPAMKFPDNPLPSVECISSRVDLSPYQSSEELADECSQPDERWESSPGFDVLVDDVSERLEYGDDADFLLAQGEGPEMLHGNLLHYDFESDLRSSLDGGLLYEPGLYDSYHHLDKYNSDRYIPEYFDSASKQPRERMLEPMLHQKRKLLCREYEVGSRRDVDFQDPLWKHRRTDIFQSRYSSREHRSYRPKFSIREQVVRLHGMGRLQGRLASELGNDLIISSQSRTLSTSKERSRRGWFGGNPQPKRRARARRREREHRRDAKPPPAISSEISRVSVSKQLRSKPVTTASFTGPKTLAQIKEEKSRGKANDDASGSQVQHLRRSKSEDFEGPKPLHELLEDKRKALSVDGDMDDPASIGSQVEKRVGGSCMAESKGLRYLRTSVKDQKYESDFPDDYGEDGDGNGNGDDDDDDGLRKKLAHILSQ